jgi:hypothetical protein
VIARPADRTPVGDPAWSVKTPAAGPQLSEDHSPRPEGEDRPGAGSVVATWQVSPLEIDLSADLEEPRRRNRRRIEIVALQILERGISGP